MKKESKNLGITKACPNCRKTLLKSANFFGQGSFQTKCPHCKNLVLVELNPHPFVKLTSLLPIILGFGIVVVGVWMIWRITNMSIEVISNAIP